MTQPTISPKPPRHSPARTDDLCNIPGRASAGGSVLPLVDEAAGHLAQAIGFARVVYLLSTEFPLTDSRDRKSLAAISRALVDSLDAADHALSPVLMPEG